MVEAASSAKETMMGPNLPAAAAIMFTTAPMPAPMAEAAAVYMERMQGLRPIMTTVAAVRPVTPALMTVKTGRAAPPMEMLWAVANKLPAATFPIPACIPAAAVPDREIQSVYAEKFGFYITGGVEEWAFWT